MAQPPTDHKCTLQFTCSTEMEYQITSAEDHFFQSYDRITLYILTLELGLDKLPIVTNFVLHGF